MSAPDWLIRRPIAHRGLHDGKDGRAENSLGAAAAARDAGYAIEVDIRLSADGVPMVFHDAHLDRMTGQTGPLAARSAAALQTIELRDGSGHVPTLDELLALVAGRVPLFLELKADADGSDATRLVSATATRLTTYDGPAAIMSFAPDVVSAALRMETDRPIGLVSCRFDSPKDVAARPAPVRFALRHLLPALIHRPHFIAYDVRALPTLATRLARRSGLPLLTWTVRSEADRRTAAAHADQMIFEGFRPVTD